MPEFPFLGSCRSARVRSQQYSIRVYLPELESIWKEILPRNFLLMHAWGCGDWGCGDALDAHYLIRRILMGLVGRLGAGALHATNQLLLKA